MKLNGVNAFFSKESMKYEAKSAAISAGISAAATLAINKGKDIKQAGRVGLIAAGASLTVGAVAKAIALFNLNKNFKSDVAAAREMNYANHMCQNEKEQDFGYHGTSQG